MRPLLRRSVPHRPRAALAIALLLTAMPSGVSRAAQAVFDYRVDRFEVTGQVSFVDEFDDGVLAPWTVGVGTVADTGLEMSLRSPGVLMPRFWSFVTGSPTAPSIDVSNARLAGPTFAVSAGSGHFVATSTWTTLPTAPPGSIGGFYAMSILIVGAPLPRECIHAPNPSPAPVVTRTFTVAMRDFNAVVPPYVGPPGLAMGLNETVVCVFDPNVPSRNEMETHAPEAAAVVRPVTGDLVLRLSWDDTLGQMTPLYSVDGGASFQAPFLPRSVSFTGASFQLLGDPVVATELPAAGTALRLLLVVALLLTAWVARAR